MTGAKVVSRVVSIVVRGLGQVRQAHKSCPPRRWGIGSESQMLGPHSRLFSVEKAEVSCKAFRAEAGEAVYGIKAG